MKARLSALFDDAIEDGDLEHLCRALRKVDELRDCGRMYPLIGDVLRGESALDLDITAAVMKQIDGEPPIAVNRRRSIWQKPLLAVAASMAGVALVAWLAVPLSHQAGPLAMKNGSHAEVVAVAAPVKIEAAHDMREYLIAHQAQTANLQFQGGSEHVRTVSYDSGK